MKLKLEKIPVLGSKFWRELGGKIPFWVMDDAAKGLMQDNQQKLWYKSAQYKKYKANEMRKFGRGKKKTGKGDKLSGYKAVSTDTHTQFVNMKLTGQMLNSLGVVEEGDTYVDMSFKPEHAGKIIGNRELGREIVGLNWKNIRKAKVEIIRELKKRQLEFIPKNITITVGK